ncbi:MAG: transpeptidase family protein [Bacteroides sp.]|nr:transpeptidase family protein [Bacteroides sp.]
MAPRKPATPRKKSKRASMMSRYAVVSVLFIAAALWIAYNTFKNTVIDAPHWNELAKKELSRTDQKIKPERGDILAADGSVLATTLRYYTLRMDFGSEAFHWKAYVEKKDSLADSLARYFPIPGGVEAWRDSLEAPLRRKRRPRGWRLISNISYADYQQIKQFPFFKGRRLGNHGLQAEPMLRRRNPYGSMAKLSIGVVSERSNGEIHGMSGLEYALDSLLYGREGTYKKVNFTRGIGNWVENPAIPGWNVESTIDVQMQDILENALLDRLKYCRAEWGTAVLMEVSTGEIKGICNLEEDPAHKGEGIYIEAMNRAVRRFEPGSVVKPLSMMIAIEDGYVNDLDSVIQIGSAYKAFGQGRPITDSHYNSELTVAGCIEQSSNIGMARLLSKYYRSPQGWHDRVAQTGFLEKLKSGIGEESAPWFPVVPLDRGGLVTLSRQFYGYGAEIPPLHTLSIYNAIANGGRYVRPRLVKALHRQGIDSIVPVSYVRERACSERTAKMMQQCLSLVVNGDHGTARSLRNPYVTLAGKTGTCYSVNPETRQYDTARKRLAFCGYFPAENPKYSCVVLIYHPRENVFGAATTSGTVLRDVAIAMFARGMLGNRSDYVADAAADESFKETRPTVFASTGNDLARLVESTTGAKPKRIGGGAAVESGVPDVRGMGLREAVATLERAGLEVSFKGIGHVASQTPSPGSPLSAGKVNLTLRQ